MGSNRGELTQEDILAWADNLAGTSVNVTAKKQGVSRQAIHNRRKKVAEFIADKFDINEYRLPLYGLYGLWLSSVIRNLKKNDTTMTVAIGKGLNLLVDKREIDSQHGITGLSNDELAERICRHFGADTSGKD